MAAEVLDFQRLFEATPGLYLVLTRRLAIVAVTRAYLDATMRRREDIVGRGIFEVFPDNPDDQGATGVANLRTSLEHVLRERRAHTMAVQRYDIERPAAEGGGYETRHWSPTNSPVLDDAGEVAWIVHAVTDVTEFVRLRQRDHAQARLQQELESRAGQMEAEIYLRAQEIQRANHALEALHAELEARVAERTRELSAANEALLQSEEQRRQSQKLEAVGHLAGGVAHDFNNLLSVILSFTEMARWSLAAGHPAVSDLEQVERAGQRAADLSRQLLAFSRRQVMDLRVLDLNAIVRNMAIMLRRVVGEHIEFRTALSAGLRSVLADPGQIEQVLMNLVVNARDAMPRGGKLTVETADVDLDEGFVAGHLGAATGPHVMLAVSDTGVGMDRLTQQRIFEPFFTTKAPGRGSGLGLSTVFGIVKQFQGHVWVYSEPGAGTSFKVYFPVAVGPNTWAPAPPPEALDLRGHETLLLVEDEDQVRAAAAGILRRAGYTVLETRSPREALATCQEFDGEIHLVLTDIVMPGMNGRELSLHIAALRPTALTLFMSGYTDNVIQHHGVLSEGESFLQKPFTPASLARMVRVALERRRGAATPAG